MLTWKPFCILLMILLLLLTGCTAAFRKELVPAPEPVTTPSAKQYSVNVMVNCQFPAEPRSPEVARIFQKAIAQAFKDSGLFSEITVNEKLAKTDFQAEVTLKAIYVMHGLEEALRITFGVIPFYSDAENFDLSLVLHKQNGEIASSATFHEETRIWNHLVFALPFWGEDEPTRSHAIAYNLTRAGLAKVNLQTDAAPTKDFY